MKKVKIVMLFVMLSIFTAGLLAFYPKTSVSAQQVIDQSGVGYSINMAKPYYDGNLAESVIMGASVLSNDYLNSLTQEKQAIGTKSEKTDSTITNSGKGYSILYYTWNTSVEEYSLSLPRYEKDLSEYQNHLSAFFEASIEKVANGEMTCKEFFDLYGTDFIASGIFGGNLEIGAILESSEFVFSNSSKDAIKRSLDATFSFPGSDSSLSLSIALNDIIYFSEYDISYMFYAKANGGIPFDITNSNQSYIDWLNSLTDKSVLIGFDDEDLIPIWDMIPESSPYSSVKSALEAYYPTYLAESENENETEYTSPYSLDTYITSKALCTSDEHKITNHKNGYVFLNLETYYGIDTTILENAGYNMVDVIIKMDVKEVNNGNQNISLYNSEVYNSDNLLYKNKISLGDNKTEKNYTTETFYIKDIPISSIPYNVLVLKFGASGFLLNTWKYQNMTVQLVFRK